VTVRSRVDGQLMKLAFTEGQDVQSNQVIALIDPAPFRTMLDQAIARKAQDEAQYTNALIEEKREAALLEAKIDAQATYDSAKALADQMAATVKADQAAIENAQVQLDYCTITSPIEGRTGIRQVDQGNVIHTTDTNGLVVITQLKPISVIFTFPEQYLNSIHQQSNGGDFIVLAVDRDNATVLDTGKLAVIDNQIDTTTSTIRLKANFPNPNFRLWPGQFVNVRLLLTTRSNGIVVPASVVQRGPEGALATYAFVTEGEGDQMKAKQRPIKVAQIDQGQALIDSGLSEGETVVVDGQYKLQEGSRIRPSGSGGGRGGGPKPAALGGTSE
jgi:multidrug efflux system membrane fusion protein